MTLIFCDAEDNQLKLLRIILILFELVSGLHFSQRKSHIFPINVVPKIQHRLDVLGGEIGQLPSTYLGMLLGVKSQFKEIWNVVERCEKRLSRWNPQIFIKRWQIIVDQPFLGCTTNLMYVFHLPAKVEPRKKE